MTNQPPTDQSSIDQPPTDLPPPDADTRTPAMATPFAAADGTVPPAAAPPVKPASVRRRVLTIGLAVVVAVGSAIATNAILHAVNDRPSSEGEQPSGGEQPSDDQPSDDQPSDDQGEVFTSAEDGFSVVFPGEPQVQSIVQEIGEFDIPITVYSTSAGNVQFLVSAAEMPASVLEAQDLDTFLTNSLTGSVEGGGAELTSQSFTTLSGERAITGTMTAESLTLHTVIALHNGLQFSVSVISDDEAAAQAFFDSFTFD